MGHIGHMGQRAHMGRMGPCGPWAHGDPWAHGPTWGPWSHGPMCPHRPMGPWAPWAPWAHCWPGPRAHVICSAFDFLWGEENRRGAKQDTYKAPGDPSKGRPKPSVYILGDRRMRKNTLICLLLRVDRFFRYSARLRGHFA